MAAHTVTVTPDSANGAALDFAAPFNAAVAFIDRHIGEGRSGKSAILTTAGEEVSYGQLAIEVNRYGNALRGLGIETGDRLLMVVKDCPEFFFVFWGAIKAGIVPGAAQHAAHGEGLPLHDRRFGGLPPSSGRPSLMARCAMRSRKQTISRPICCRRTGRRRWRRRPPTASNRIPAKPATIVSGFIPPARPASRKAAIHRHRDMVVTSQQYGVDLLGVGEDDICFSAAKLFFAPTAWPTP